MPEFVPSVGGSSPSSTSASSGEVSVTKFKRNAFLLENGTGLNVVGKHMKEGEMKSEYFDFGEKLRQQYLSFLDNHTARLSALFERDAGRYKSIIGSEEHKNENDLMAQICDVKVDEHGNITAMVPSKQKLAQFLDNPSGLGWKIVTQLIDEQDQLRKFGVGLQTLASKEGLRTDPRNPQTVLLDIDRGALHKFLHDNVGPNWQKILAGTGIAALAGSTAISEANNSHIGTLVSAGVLAVGGLLKTGQSARNPGLSVDIKQCAAGLNVIKGNAIEKDYLWEVMGISVDDYKVDAATNEVVRDLTATRIPRTKKTREQLQEEIFQTMLARTQFYKALGVPSNKLDAMSSSFLLKEDLQQPESTGTVMEHELQGYFDPNKMSPTDIEKNIRDSMKANRKYTSSLLERYVKRKLEQDVSSKDQTTVGTLESQIKSRQRGGEAYDGRVKALGEEKTAIDQQKTLVDQQITEVGQYQEAKKRIVETEARLGELGVVGTNSGAIDAAISGREDQLNPLKTGSFPDQIRGARTTMEGHIDTRRGALTMPRTTKAKIEVYDLVVKGIKEDEQSKFEYTRTSLQEQITKIQGEVTELKKLKKEYPEQVKAVHGASHMNNSDRLVDEMYSACESLLHIETVVPGVGLTEAALAGENMDQIMQRINAAYTSDPSVGWAKENNTNPEHRMIVINSMNEAKARQKEPTYITRRAEFSTLRSFGIAGNLLRTLDENQVMRLINKIYTDTGGAKGWDTAENTDPVRILTLQNAIREAKDRVSIRYDIRPDLLQAESVDLQRLSVTKQHEIDHVDDLFTEERKFLNEVKEVVSRQSYIRQQCEVVASSRDLYFSDPPDEGYKKILDLLFDYSNKSDKASSFTHLSESTLEQETLAVYLDEFLLGAARGTGRTDIDEVFNDLRGSIRSVFEYAQAFRLIANELRSQAFSLPK
ncbi:MAG TPA: hypothetical protein VMR41_04340 [Patescibacteria group bacterium]|nr:hypothetical protein [Patescibacteria group bacterium]